uniref:Serine-threonine protein kinase, plant-type n=1 Tax=Solanum tuberosum TaxID=4113 RepID=M1AB21_SOLTU
MSHSTGYTGKFRLEDLILISLTNLLYRMKDCVVTLKSMSRLVLLIRRISLKSKKRRLIWIIVASSVISVIGTASVIVFVLMRCRGKTINAEEEWSPEVAPQRISYYELQRATQGFDVNNLLGSGWFCLQRDISRWDDCSCQSFQCADGRHISNLRQRM